MPPIVLQALHCLLEQYISNLVEFREPDNGLELDTIDDKRNGLLLLKQIHDYFGLGSLAFLRVRFTSSS